MQIVSDSQSPIVSAINNIIRWQTIVITTSGTTGSPKTYTKDFTKALAKKKQGTPDERWLLCYNPARWAGVSVILHACKAGATLIVPNNFDTTSIVEAGVKYKPTHISMTPSLFITCLIRSEAALRVMPIKQITFGGEAVTQFNLDCAKLLWPQARVTHIYASTELGDLLAVSDGLAGIPKQKFEGYSFSPQGELIVNELQTGDLWELREDRYYFLGRVQEIINVGGNKVSPIVVEQAALQSGAQMAKVYAIPAPLLGFAVALDYVGEIESAELLKKMATLLPKYAWPRRMRKLNSIALTAAGKVQRNEISDLGG